MTHLATDKRTHPRYRPARTIPTDPYALLGTPELGQLLGVARETIYRWRMAGLLPAPDRVLPGARKVWFRSTVEQWLSHEAAR